MKGMEINGRPIVYDIGYQCYTPLEFVAKMKAEGVTMVVDVRAKPWSKKPGFNKKDLQATLATQQVLYQHHGEMLGGNRRPRAWDEGVRRLAKMAEVEQLCIMCVEEDRDKCHRKQLAVIFNDFKCHTIALRYEG